MKKILLILLFGSLAGSFFFAQRDIYERRIDYRLEDRIFLLPRQDVLKVFSLGHDKAVADLLWIRAVQFFGGNFSTLIREGFEFKGEGIRKLIHTVQYLDPDFYKLYGFGAFVFAEGLKDYHEAIRFLEMGSEIFEEDYHLLFEAAFVAFHYLEDNDLALELAERVNKRPNVPEHIKRFAGQILSRLGKFEVAEQHFLRIYEESQSEAQREISRINLNRVRRERDVFILREKVEEYKQHFGEAPRELADLVAVGLIPFLPLDPDGSPYHYNPRSDQVISYNQALLEQQQLLRELQNMADEFYTTFQKHPKTLEDLEQVIPEPHPRGIIQERAQDPLGGKFAIDPATHQVYVIPAGVLDEMEQVQVAPQDSEQEEQ